VTRRRKRRDVVKKQSKQTGGQETSPATGEAGSKTGGAPDPRRRRSRAKQLVVTSNLALPPEILPWERELLFPVVNELVNELLMEMGTKEESDG